MGNKFNLDILICQVTSFPRFHWYPEKILIGTSLFTFKLGRAAHVGVLVGPASMANVRAPVPSAELQDLLSGDRLAHFSYKGPAIFTIGVQYSSHLLGSYLSPVQSNSLQVSTKYFQSPLISVTTNFKGGDWELELAGNPSYRSLKDFTTWAGFEMMRTTPPCFWTGRSSSGWLRKSDFEGVSCRQGTGSRNAHRVSDPVLKSLW